MLLVNPMQQSMDDLGKVLHLIVENSNGHLLALLFILLGTWWHPLLLLRLGWHNLDLFQCSPYTINGHTVHDHLVLGTGDISKHVGPYPLHHLVWLGWKKVDLLGNFDWLWCI